MINSFNIYINIYIHSEEVVRAAAPATHRSNSATSNLLATEECYLFTTDSTIYRRQFRKCYTVINKNYSKWSEEPGRQTAWFLEDWSGGRYKSSLGRYFCYASVN